MGIGPVCNDNGGNHGNLLQFALSQGGPSSGPVFGSPFKVPTIVIIGIIVIVLMIIIFTIVSGWLRGVQTQGKGGWIVKTHCVDFQTHIIWRYSDMSDENKPNSQRQTSCEKLSLGGESDRHLHHITQVKKHHPIFHLYCKCYMASKATNNLYNIFYIFYIFNIFNIFIQNRGGACDPSCLWQEEEEKGEFL